MLLKRGSCLACLYGVMDESGKIGGRKLLEETFLISQCFISTSAAFFAGDTKCFRAFKKGDHDQIRQWCYSRKIDLNEP